MPKKLTLKEVRKLSKMLETHRTKLIEYQSLANHCNSVIFQLEMELKKDGP